MTQGRLPVSATMMRLGRRDPKTVEQTRKLVEQDEVAAIFSPLGAPTGIAVRKYLNGKKVQLFVASG